MKHLRSRKANIATAAAIAQGLVLGGCQAGLGGATAQPSSLKLSFIAEFKKIDSAGKSRITMDQAVSYYSGLFSQLDKKWDGFLDAQELEAKLPALDAKSGKELVLEFDRNSDGKLSRSEFLVMTNWLFQLARSQTHLSTVADNSRALRSSITRTADCNLRGPSGSSRRTQRAPRRITGSATTEAKYRGGSTSIVPDNAIIRGALNSD